MCLPNINDLKSLSLNMARLKPSFPYMQSAFSESACLHPNNKLISKIKKHKKEERRNDAKNN
jgi:hypothetical protein